MRALALALFIPSLASAGSIIRGGTSGTNADVDTTTQALKVQPKANAKTDAPYMMIKGDNAVGGGYVPDVTSNKRLMVGEDSWQFIEPVNGSTVNGGIWTVPVTTFTIAQANGIIQLNNASTAAANSVARLSSVPVFGHEARTPIEVVIRFKPENLAITNTTAEIGLFTATGTSAITDGVYFRWNAAGTFVGAMNFNGSETTTANLSVPVTGNWHLARIVLTRDDIHFYMDEVEVADLDVPVTQAGPMLNKNPVTARVFVGGSAAALAPRIGIGSVGVRYLGGPVNDLPTAWGMAQRNLNLHPSTFAELSLANNGTVNMTLTANTAPATAGLGGDFIFGAPAGAASLFPIFAYLVPTGFRAVITGVHISACQYGAATATTPTILQWYLGTGSTGTALNTANAADFSTLAPRKIPIATQGFPIDTRVGVCANEVDVTFRTPVVVESGRYVHAILAVPIGTATASEVIRGSVTFNGYIE